MASYAIDHSPEHITRDRRRGTYCTIREAATGRLAGRLHVIHHPGGFAFRSFLDDAPMPEGLSFDQAIQHAIADEAEARKNRPPRKPHQKPQRGGYRGRYRRQYPAPPVRHVSEYRRRLVAKLQNRWANSGRLPVKFGMDQIAASVETVLGDARTERVMEVSSR